TLREVERQMILHALQANDNNRTHAAEILGISVRTLRNKLHEYRSQGIID
ncbi:MAG: helix-turn-helix domain-containing protein, partial [Desulfurivibrionaceae bacterium]